ncbi:Serum response factor [Acipenser ruthenus]|uniref:Serum response factor n=1 Tax=Acipenser ruthenus TaxID=7906 RepID=A0A444UJ93_ACIRT|nr:Serum response factor [Acipenser ruthenus]
MLGGNGATGGSRGGQRAGNGAGAGGLGSMGSVVGGQGVSRFDPDRETSAMGFSGSDADSDSADDDELAGLGQGTISRGVKRERAEIESGVMGQGAGTPAGGYSGVSGGVAGAKPGKKTRGRVKIKMEFIDNKLRRYTTFSKRKTGIMKKAYELSTLTGTQVLLLVASETGHVYTFATRKLQPMITSETGKALIQTCLNSPDSPPRSDPTTDQRMSATGFEETDLTYQVSESDSSGETKDTLKPAFTVASLPGTSTCNPTAPTTTTMQVSSGASFPITNYLAPISASGNANSITSANGTVLKTAATSGGVMQLPSGFTFMSGTPLPPGTPTIPISQLQSHSLAIQGQPGQTITGAQGQQTVFRFPASVSLAVSLPATIVTSSVPTTMAGHMMYPSPHTLMYASTPALADGSLAVLNAFTQAPSAMQVSHGQVQEQGENQGKDEQVLGELKEGGGVPQVFLTGPPGTVQIPVSAVQLHPVRKDLHFTSETLLLPS